MGRTVTKTCDVCRKPTARIVGKLRFSPMIPGISRGDHTDYTHHLDVGVCCKDKIFRGLRFRKRQTIKEYAETRKNGNS